MPCGHFFLFFFYILYILKDGNSIENWLRMKTRTILSKNLDAAFSIKKVYVQIFLKHTLFVMAAAGI